MRQVLILVGLTLLCSCSLTTSIGTYFARDFNDATLEAVGNFMANGHTNKIVEHPEVCRCIPFRISSIQERRSKYPSPLGVEAQTITGFERIHGVCLPTNMLVTTLKLRRASFAGEQKS